MGPDLMQPRVLNRMVDKTDWHASSEFLPNYLGECGKCTYF